MFCITSTYNSKYWKVFFGTFALERLSILVINPRINKVIKKQFIFSQSVSHKFQMTFQARSQDFFRVGEVFWNQGTSINILSTKHERQALQRKKLDFFFPGNSQNHILNEKFNSRWPQSEHFFQN